VKKLTVFCVLFVSIFVGITLYARAQTLELNFEYITVYGRVVDQTGAPVANLRLEVELAPGSELLSELNLPGENMGEIIGVLKKSVGSGVWTTVITDEKGEYAVKGVPVPGIYRIYLRNHESYLPTYVKVVLNQADKKEFKAPDLIASTRKGGAAAGPIPEKAMKEVEKARTAVDEKDTKKAIKHMLKALELEPEYAEGHYNLAVMYMSEKKRDEAIQHLEKAVQIQENYKPALKTLGELYLFKKDFARAADYFERYLAVRQKEGELTLEDAKIYFQTGNCFQAVQQRDKAVPYFRNYLGIKQKAAGLDQKDALLCSDIGSYYYSKKDPKNAAIFYGTAVKVNPEIGAETYMYLGNSYVAMRDGAAAIKYYEKYLELDPKGKFSAQLKTMLDTLKKMYPEAAQDTEKENK
jgi:tetratricopeptide (TPR) repeat protein